MIKKEEIVEIGKFQKTHALQGELNALLDVDIDFGENDEPMIVDMDGIFVPFYVENIRGKGATSFLVKLDGVDNVDEAKKFVNKAIYARRSDMLDYFDTPEEEFAAESDLIGCIVKDCRLGEIGEVTDLDDSTANVLLVVGRPDGGEVYIPFVEDIVKEINIPSRTVEIDAPEGLLDLNDKKSKQDE